MTLMTRSDLKNIVKECLVEILSEGIGGRVTEAKRAPAAATPKSTERSLVEMHKMKQSIANSIQYGRPASSKSSPQSAVKSLVKSVTNDDVMAALFADTAKTTLQEQVESDRRLLRGHADDDAPEDDTPSAGQGFSEEMSRHWSSLAFSESKKQK